MCIKVQNFKTLRIKSPNHLYWENGLQATATIYFSTFKHQHEATNNEKQKEPLYHNVHYQYYLLFIHYKLCRQ